MTAAMPQLRAVFAEISVALAESSDLEGAARRLLGNAGSILHHFDAGVVATRILNAADVIATAVGDYGFPDEERNG